MALKIGDVVRLKSGSPKLVVESIVGGMFVRCMWVDLTGNILDRNIAVEALELSK